MNLYKIEDIKKFTECLFIKESFDKFCVADVELKTLVPITIRGNLSDGWLSDEDRECYGHLEYVPWKLLRPIVFSLIRGRQTPGMMRINFVHHMENGDIGGLRIQYEKAEMMCISTYTTVDFTLDKSGERMWDERCSEFLKKNQIVSTLAE